MTKDLVLAICIISIISSLSAPILKFKAERYEDISHNIISLLLFALVVAYFIVTKGGYEDISLPLVSVVMLYFAISSITMVLESRIMKRSGIVSIFTMLLVQILLTVLIMNNNLLVDDKDDPNRKS